MPIWTPPPMRKSVVVIIKFQLVVMILAGMHLQRSLMFVPDDSEVLYVRAAKSDSDPDDWRTFSIEAPALEA